MRTILTTLLLMLTAIAHAHYYVVCVGIADYPGRQNDLRVSANDAMTIYNIYTKNGDADARCLTNADATLAKVRQAMAETFAKATENDAVIFYFSGHGIPGGFVCQDGYLLYKEVVLAMGKTVAKNKMVIADACFAGKMRASAKNNGEEETHNSNVMFFLSSRTTEPSRETRYANSLFTIFLERGLRGGADTNHDRTVCAREMYDFVHKGVVEASHNKQHPVMWGNFDKNMTIIKW